MSCRMQHGTSKQGQACMQIAECRPPHRTKCHTRREYGILETPFNISTKLIPSDPVSLARVSTAKSDERRLGEEINHCKTPQKPDTRSTTVGHGGTGRN
jgi:hypothetical protein